MPNTAVQAQAAKLQGLLEAQEAEAARLRADVQALQGRAGPSLPPSTRWRTAPPVSTSGSLHPGQA